MLLHHTNIQVPLFGEKRFDVKFDVKTAALLKRGQQRIHLFNGIIKICSKIRLVARRDLSGLHTHPLGTPVFRMRSMELRLSHFKEPATGGVVKSREGLSTVKVKTVHLHINSLSVDGFAIEESGSYILLK